MQRNTVVLPAPFGPQRRDRLTLADLEAQIINRGQSGKPLREALYGDCRQ